MDTNSRTHAKLTASQRVAEYLRRNIDAKAWQVGAKIPSENTLTRELGVSRVSVRLAIQQFITLGVLESIHGKGTYLRSDDPGLFASNAARVAPDQCRDIAKVLQFRLLLEPEASYLAVGVADDALVQRLDDHLHSLVAHIGSAEDFVRHDILFHLEISAACGNPLIHRALADTFDQTRQDHTRINDLFGYKDGVYYHSLLVKAFRSRDAKGARKLMAEHLEQALDELDKQPEAATAKHHTTPRG